MADDDGSSGQVPSFKDRLAMFNQQSTPAGPPPPKPKPREWKRPAAPVDPPPPTSSSDAPSPAPAAPPKPANTSHGDSEPQRDFSATDAKASISQGGGSLKERMAKLQGLNPVAQAPSGTPASGRTNLRPWESTKSPTAEEEQDPVASNEPSESVDSPSAAAAASAPGPVPSTNDDEAGDQTAETSSAAQTADESKPSSSSVAGVPAEQGIQLGSAGPSAPLAVPRRAGPPRRRPQAAKTPSSTSAVSQSAASATEAGKEEEAEAPQESAHAASQDDIPPQPHAVDEPDDVPHRERDTATSPQPVAETRRQEAQEGMDKKEMPVSGLDQQTQPSSEETEDESGEPAGEREAQPENAPVEEEEDEQARKQRLASKMAAMGGQKLGMFPVPAPSAAPPPPPPARQASQSDHEQQQQDDAPADPEEAKVSTTAGNAQQQAEEVKTAPETDVQDAHADPTSPTTTTANKPDLPALPPQFAKDAEDSDEDQERDAEWDEDEDDNNPAPPQSAPAPPPPLPPSRPAPDVAEEEAMEKDVPQAEDLTDAPEPASPTAASDEDPAPAPAPAPAPPARAPPPLPAGRPMEAPPASQQALDEAEDEAPDNVATGQPVSRQPSTAEPAQDAGPPPPPPPGRPSERKLSQSSPTSGKPVLGLDTQSASSRPASMASPASPVADSRRSSVQRPKVPPPFSPQTTEQDTGPPLSPRRSIDSNRRSLVLESPPISPRPTQTESRPISIIDQASQPVSRRASTMTSAADDAPEAPPPPPAASAATGEPEAQEAAEGEKSEEQEEAERRSRIAERMRKLGGQKFGMFGMPMPGGPKPPSRQPSTAETDAEESAQQPKSPEVAEESPALEKRKSGGMPKGGVALAGIIPPKPPAPTTEQQEDDDQAEEGEKDSEPVEEEREAQEQQEEASPEPAPQSPGAPPPLPPARPAEAPEDIARPPDSPPAPASPLEQPGAAASPTLPSRPAGGHAPAVASPPSSAGAERLSFIQFDDKRQSLNLADPRDPSANDEFEVQSPNSPRMSRAPTTASAVAAAPPTAAPEASAAPASASSPLDQYTESELMSISERYGSQVFAKAKSKSREGTRWPGDNPSYAFVSSVLAEVSDLEPPKVKGEFGQCVYRMSSANHPMPSPDTIRIGDILVVRQAKIRAKIGSTSLGMGSTPFAAIVEDYDPKKSKVHYLEASKSGKIESGGFHLDHLKEGTVEIYRAVPSRA